MTNSRKILFSLLLALFSVLSASCQDPDAGLKPYVGYVGGSFDHIDPATGKLSIALPLFSYKQRGSLPDLGFSIQLTTNYWPEHAVCDENLSWEECYVYFDQPILGPQIKSNFQQYSLLPLSNVLSVPFQGCIYLLGCFNTQTGGVYYSLSTADGGSVPLFPDRSQPSIMRALDGSGFSFFGNNLYYDPFLGYGPNPAGTLYDSRGNRYTNGASGSNEVARITDPNGNSVSSVMASSSQFSLQYNDSVGRTITDPGAYVNGYIDSLYGSNAIPDTTKCPNLGRSDQPARFSTTWLGPGPNGGTQSYTFCYTDIGYHTGFYSFSSVDEYPWPWVGYNRDAADWESYNSNRLNGGTVNTIGGAAMLQSIVLPNGTYWGFQYDQPASYCCSSTSFINSGQDFPAYVATHGLEESYASLTKIITPTGGSISYEYQPMQRNATRTWPSAFRAIKTRATDDGQGNQVVTSFSYGISNGHYTTTETTANRQTVHTFFESSAFESGQSGGAASLLESNTDVYDTSSGSPSHLQATEYTYDYTYTFSGAIANTRTSSVKTTDVPSGFFQSTQYVYGSQYPLAAYWCSVGPTSSCSAQTSPNGMSFVAKLQTPTEVDTYDNNGLLVSKVSTPRHSVYPAFESLNILDPVDNDKVMDAAGATLLANSYTYDAAGNMLSVSNLADSSRMITTQYGRDSHGMINSITDPLQNVTTPVYDSSGIYLSSLTHPSTNGVTHKEYFQYDDNTGALLKHVDENGSSIDDSGHATTFTYQNGSGLLQETVGPPVTLNGGSVHPDTQYQYNFSSGLRLTTSVLLETGKQSNSVQAYDGLARMAQSSLMTGAASYIAVDHCFDSYGNESFVTNPHVVATTTASGCSGIVGTGTQFDVLGRPSVTTFADGVTENLQYFGNNVAIFRGGTLRRLEAHDGLNRLTRVCEMGAVAGTASVRDCGIAGFSGISGAVTTYTYDALGHVTIVNQLGGNGDTARVRRFVYDGLSRLTYACNPESLPAGQTCDGNTWSATYGYDDNSNLHTATDSRGQTVTYTYDHLNRLLSKQQTGPNAAAFYGYASCYLYDGYGSSSTSNMHGRLSAEWTQAGACPENATSVSASAVTRRVITGYDALGQVLGEQTCVSSGCSNRTRTLGYSYDLAGNLLTYTDARGLTTFTQAFDPAGRFRGLESSTSDATHPSRLMRISSYGPYGWTSGDLGGALSLNRAYDSRMRVSAYSATHP